MLKNKGQWQVCSRRDNRLQLDKFELGERGALCIDKQGICIMLSTFLLRLPFK